MKAIVGKNSKEGVTFVFEEAGLKHEDSLKMRRQSNYTGYNLQQADMKHFLKDSEPLDLPEIKNQPEIDKIKKRIEAFAKQYGEKTQKTTSIFMNYLQTVREAGVTFLKNKDILKSASYFAQCLRFVDPKYDQIFYQKFLIVKIDAINKLMYCIFELESMKNRDSFLEDKQFKKVDRYLNAETILTQFLEEVHEFQKIETLKKSQNCMLEVNYFYLGRLRRKNKSKTKAIEAFKQAIDLIEVKLSSKYSSKNEQIRVFLLNLRVKAYYKLSKCYREIKNDELQEYYQNLALNEAKLIGNSKLQCYIRRKIIFYRSKQEFLNRIAKLQGKRKIEQEVSKLIDFARQNEIKSLYSIYNFQPAGG